METDILKLEQSYADLKEQFEKYKSNSISLDISRGKPSTQQLDLSSYIINDLDKNNYMSKEGFDCRNYGVGDGIPEAKELFAEMLGVDSSNIYIGGNSSLSLMYDMVSYFITHGSCLHRPWIKDPGRKFLCPSPGYDRHFAITEFFGIENVPVGIDENGPDMDLVEKLVSEDPSIKGIWCVPKYSNPTGCVYSDQVVKRFANLKPASQDFRIFWDYAYGVHDLYEEIKILNILEECEKAGNPDMPIIFSSFSKISFAGSSISCIAASVPNIYYFNRRLLIQTVGSDKLNQLRHTNTFKNLDAIREHMKNLGEILRPKMELVLNKLDKELSNLDICTWSKPKGGYFISFNSMDGCASKIIDYCKQCGLILTAAGSTYPQKNDVRDHNIRIAFSYPGLDELDAAMDIFCTCVKLVSIEKILNH